jgi:hypothetical protein
MHVIFFPKQVGWFDSKGINFHPWGSRINPHEWHGLWVDTKMLIEYSLIT